MFIKSSLYFADRSDCRPYASGRLGLLTSKELYYLLQRERARSDRCGRRFSFVSLTLSRHDWISGGAADLVEILNDRLRITDDIGVIGNRRIGVVLPETASIDAIGVVDHVCNRYEENRDPLTYDLFEYPTDEDAMDQSAHQQHQIEALADHGPPLKSMCQLFIRPLPTWKRTIDILGATIGLIVSIPVLLVSALLIKMNSPGPVFFAQRRTGLDGNPFTIYKLRTMYVDAEARKAGLQELNEQDGPAFKMANDPRVTQVGYFLRKSRLDELPQFWNVLCGNMTLVGPRPLPCDESNACELWQKRRLDVTPGLTCVWQIHGGSHVPFSDWMRMDIRYINSRSFGNDVKLLFYTLLAVLFRRTSS